MIYYTVHAKTRMIFREITEEMVRRTLANPDKTGQGYGGKNLAYKKFKAKILKVVYKQKKDSYIIVSVIWD